MAAADGTRSRTLKRKAAVGRHAHPRREAGIEIKKSHSASPKFLAYDAVGVQAKAVAREDNSLLQVVDTDRRDFMRRAPAG